jgi:5-methylcytosine-specific restriction endonuclease McrA
MCCQCGKETVGNKNYCEKHYLQKISHTRLGTSKFWQELKLLIERQNYKCALTGDAISFEDNIELDHKLPTYRGGANDLSNVQWVTKEANWFKRALTENELLTLCEKILLTLKK